MTDQIDVMAGERARAIKRQPDAGIPVDPTDPRVTSPIVDPTDPRSGQVAPLALASASPVAEQRTEPSTQATKKPLADEPNVDPTATSRGDDAA